MIDRGERRIIGAEISKDSTMVRRARKPLLPQLLWGPQKRTYRRTGQVIVMRIPAQSGVVARRPVEDFMLATGLFLIISLLVTHQALANLLYSVSGWAKVI